MSTSIPLTGAGTVSGTAAFNPANLTCVKLWSELGNPAKNGTTGAQQFVAGNKGLFSIADNAELSAAGSSIAIAFWIKSGLTNGHVLLAKDSGGSNNEWFIYINGNELRFLLYDSVSGSSEAGVVRTTLIDKWTFVVCQVDVDGDKKPTIYTRNASGSLSDQGTAISNTTRDSTAPFEVGGYISGATYGTAEGICKLAFWKRTLTSDERTELYNNGNGLPSGAFSAALLVDCISAWNMNESPNSDGVVTTLIDSVGSNDLTWSAAELVTNGGFETAGGGGADVFANWTESTKGTGVVADETTIVDAGSHACSLTATDASNWCNVRQNPLSVGSVYNYSLRARSTKSRTGSIYLGNNNGSGAVALSLTTSYQTFSGVKTVTAGTGVYLETYNDAATDYFDTVSVTAAGTVPTKGPTAVTAIDSSASDNDAVISGGNGFSEWSGNTAHGAFNKFCVDGSGNDNHATAIGFADDGSEGRNTDVPSGLSGKSFVFDGSNDYISLTNFDVIGDSISIWFKTTNTSNRRLVGAIAANNSGIVLNSNTSIGVGNNNASHSFTGAAGYADGNWHHLVATWNSDTVTVGLIYDGTDLGTATITSASSTPINTIGRRLAAEFFLGSAYGFKRFENRILTPDEANYIFTNGSAGVDPGSSGLTHDHTFAEDNTLNLPTISGGGSVLLDGTDDYADCGNVIATGSSISVSAWVRFTNVNPGANDGDVIIRNDSQYRLYLYNDAGTTKVWFFMNGITATLSNGPSWAASNLAANIWYHFCGTYDGATAKLYVNGVLVDSKSVSGSLAASSDATRIGVSLGNQYWMGGNIDDVRIYDSALSAANVRQLALESTTVTGVTKTAPSDPDLGWYKFDDGPQIGTPANGDAISAHVLTVPAGKILIPPSGTIAYRPTYHTTGVDGKPCLKFDGTQILSILEKILTSTAGTVFLKWAEISDAPDDLDAWFGQFATANTTHYTQFGPRNSTEGIVVSTGDGGGAQTAQYTVATDTLAHVAKITSSGSAITVINLDGTDQTISGSTDDWWGDATTDNFSIGGARQSTISKFINAYLRHIIVCDNTATSGELGQILDYLDAN